MTEATIDRALDAWLAEHLFGWTVVGNRLGNWSLKEPGTGQWGGDAFMKELGRPWASTTHCISWSTTGDGMLAVLEAMGARHYWFNIETGIGGNNHIIKVSRGGEAGETDNSFRALYDEYDSDTSLPRAVALAAKAALEASA